jgi:uncharacterized repeat protein (TIGR01451 family)
MNQTRCLLALTMCVLLTTAVQICPAATLTCAAGDVACLIAAIHIANSTPEPDTIQLAAGTYTLTMVDNTIDGANGLPSITSALTIQGAGADQTIVERNVNAPQFRLVHVATTGSLTLHALTIRGGRGFGLREGGGIDNRGTLIISSSTISNNGADAGGGITINNSGALSLTHSTIEHNVTTHPGGGLWNVGGTVMITSTTFSSNGPADGGGGLANDGGFVTITNSTFANNIGAGGGAGLSNGFGGTVILTNSTVARNPLSGSAPQNDGGGVANFGGTVILQNTILALNTVTLGRGRGPDCFGIIISLGHNLIGDTTDCTITLQPTDLAGDPAHGPLDPGLGPFTETGVPGGGYFPLLSTSLAINAGNDAACPPQDQLGHPRAEPCDIGAVEFQSPDRQPPVLVLTLNQTAFRPGETLRMGVHLRNPGPILTTDVYVGIILPDGQTVLWLTNTAPLEGVVTRLDADPRTFTPMLMSVSWPAGLDVTQEGYLSYRFTGGEAPGIYHLLVGWTKPGSLADGRIDEGNVLALDWKAVQFTGPARILAAKARD